MASRLQKRVACLNQETRRPRKLLGCLAAVHEVRGTCDERRLVGCEKHDGLGQQHPDDQSARQSYPLRLVRLLRNARRSSRISASAPSLRSSATSFLPSSSRRPEITMREPSLANARAVARPIPVSAPVIKTTCVFISVLLLKSIRLSLSSLASSPSRTMKLSPAPVTDSVQ